MRLSARGIGKQIPSAVALFLAITSGIAQDSKEHDNAVPPEKWSTSCMEKGCIVSADILRGDSGDPPNPNDSSQYISIAVAINRNTRKPGLFFFEVDPKADKANGVFIQFGKTVRDGDHWKILLDENDPFQLQFTDCDESACRASIKDGILTQGNDSHSTDLLAKFKDSDHLFVLYSKGKHVYRTAVGLASFKVEYQRVLDTELKASQTPNNH